LRSSKKLDESGGLTAHPQQSPRSTCLAHRLACRGPQIVAYYIVPPFGIIDSIIFPNLPIEW
jgi:hypothetical protein